jgi:hypothetical protein
MPHFSVAQVGEIKITKEKKIDKIIELKINSNKSQKKIKIQIFSGSRDGAQAILSEYNLQFDNYEVKIKYESPNYKVWVGDFITKLEADKNLLKLREFFPQAFIFMTNK